APVVPGVAGKVVQDEPRTTKAPDVQAESPHHNEKNSRAEQARINGARSRGPATEEGKAASSQNALKHGFCARGVLMPDEDPGEYITFVRDFRRELGAVGTVQIMLAERAAEMAWKL